MCVWQRFAFSFSALTVIASVLNLSHNALSVSAQNNNKKFKTKKIHFCWRGLFLNFNLLLLLLPTPLLLVERQGA